MRINLILILYLNFFGCSNQVIDKKVNQINLLQSIWKSRDLSFAMKKIKNLHKVEENELIESYTTDEKKYIFSLVINVLKENNKIISIGAPISEGEEVNSEYIKSKLNTDDWKVYEHLTRGTDDIKTDVTEYSEKLGIGFAYEKLDKEKKTRMIYWGRDPKKIQTNL
jgi:hypothetical protein